MNARSARDAAERLVVLVGDLKDRLDEVEHEPMDYGTGMVIHRAEIHTIQAIGRKRGINLTRLAETSGVTKGATSQMVSKLVAKGLVLKVQSATPRELALDLTELGWKAFEAHERLHDRMIEAVEAYFGPAAEERVERMTSAVRELLALVEAYARRVQP